MPDCYLDQYVGTRECQNNTDSMDFGALGNTPEVQASAGDGRARQFEIVARLLAGDEQGWRGRVGALMYENTVVDIR
jgi:hypothetical protein